MDIERTIQFIIEQQAKFSADIDILKETVTILKDTADSLVRAQEGTSEHLTQLTEVVASLADSVSDLEVQAESDRAEIRDAIGKLVSSEEETRKFAIEIAQLVKQHEARISELENK